MSKAIQLVPAMEEGGVERYVVQLNRILVGAGWQNVVVSRGGGLDAEVARGGGRVVHQDLKSKNPLTALVRAGRLRALLKRERPDVVCAHSRVPAWLLALASRGLGLRTITYAHGANSVSRYSRVMTRGDVVMCPSTFVRTYLQDAYGTDDARFRVVPHGVDAEFFDPEKVDKTFIDAMRQKWGIGPGMKVVMSIGRITRLKGFDTLIRAMKLMTNDELRITNEGRVDSCKKGDANSAIRNSSFVIHHSSLKLIIVGGAERGKESYFDELKALVRELGLEQVVVFAGRQARTPECLSLADVVVSANTRKPESFGLSMAEALMMGKPVVAKAFGGALDIVRDGVDGVLVGSEKVKSKSEKVKSKSEKVKSKDEEVRSKSEEVVEAFAEAIAKVLQLSTFNLQPSAIRASARERFDFGIMARKTLAVYEELAR